MPMIISNFQWVFKDSLKKLRLKELLFIIKIVKKIVPNMPRKTTIANILNDCSKVTNNPTHPIEIAEINMLNCEILILRVFIN